MSQTPIIPADPEPSAAEPLPNSLVGRVVGGKWQLETKIGSGSFGEVWIAKHKVTLGQKAIKLLHPAFSAVPELVDRFVREAQAAAQIDSPHVVNVDDIGHDAGIARVYLVMELLRGESLYQYLVRPPYRMPAGEAVVILRQIAAALDAAHRVGIVHRDLKPENVFLSWRSDGTVMAKVLDFGIAKLTEPGPDSNPFNDAEGPSIRRARTITFVGTPGYAAPEQVRDAGAVTAAADVFALGVCAFEMFTGTTYWRARTPEMLFAEIAGGISDAPSTRATGAGLTDAFDQWFFQCCALDPKARFASASDAVSALEDALGQCDSLPAPPPRGDVPQIVQTTGRRRITGRVERGRPNSDPPPRIEITGLASPSPTPEPAAAPSPAVPQAATLDMPAKAGSRPTPPSAPPPAVATELLAPRTQPPSRQTAFALFAGAGLLALALVAFLRPNAPGAAAQPAAPGPSMTATTASTAVPMVPDRAPEPAAVLAPIALDDTPSPALVADEPDAVLAPSAPASNPGAPRALRNAAATTRATTTTPATRATNANTPNRAASARGRVRAHWLNYVAPGL